MTLFTLCTYFLFGIINYLIIFSLRKKYGINRLYEFIFSILLVLIYSSVLSILKEYIFITFIFQFIIDYLFTNIILDDDFFNNNNSNVIYYFSLIVIGVLLNNFFINKVDYVFLSGEDLRLVIWSLIVYSLYNFIKSNNIFTRNIEINKKLDEESIVLMFTKLRMKYNNLINVENREIELLLYSIMIFNNHNRSKFFRYIDIIKYKIFNKKIKFGIMQVNSNVFVNDIESIDIVKNELEKLSGKKNFNITKVIDKYIIDNKEEIVNIYNTLNNFFKF